MNAYTRRFGLLGEYAPQHYPRRPNGPRAEAAGVLDLAGTYRRRTITPASPTYRPDYAGRSNIRKSARQLTEHAREMRRDLIPLP